MKQIAAGVTLTQIIESSPQPLIIDILTVRPGVRGLEVAPSVANDSLTHGTGDIRKGREAVAAFVGRTGAVAAVNGDYFPYTGDPLGLGISDGELYSEPYRATDGTGRAAIGWLPSGRAIVGIPSLDARLTASDGWVLPVTGIDRLTSTTDPADVCIITSRFGPTSGARGNGTELVFTGARGLPVSAGFPVTATLSQVVAGSATAASVPVDGFVATLPANSLAAAQIQEHFHRGEKATLLMSLQDETPATIGTVGGSWNRVRQAVGGGPILLKSGQIVVDDAAEGLSGAFSTAPHARTAVGQRRDGATIIMTVDAGSALSAGISLAELADLMQAQGAVDAINLDGGGSTTMAVDGPITVDYPSGTAYERPVADILAVRSTAASSLMSKATPALQAYAVSGVPALPTIGASYPLTVSTPSGTIDGGDARILWSGPAGAVGFVSQDGMLHVTGAGQATVSARVEGTTVSATMTVPAPTAAPPPVPAPELDSSPPPFSPAPAPSAAAPVRTAPR